MLKLELASLMGCFVVSDYNILSHISQGFFEVFVKMSYPQRLGYG
jgi:hypothetical protein